MSGGPDHTFAVGDAIWTPANDRRDNSTGACKGPVTRLVGAVNDVRSEVIWAFMLSVFDDEGNCDGLDCNIVPSSRMCQGLRYCTCLRTDDMRKPAARTVSSPKSARLQRQAGWHSRSQHSISQSP